MRVAILSVIVIVVFIGGYFILNIFLGDGGERTQEEMTEIEENGEGASVEDVDEDDVSRMHVRSTEISVEDLFPMEMGEAGVQDAIHHMSHQKVYADVKWGRLEITEERIDRLLEVIEANNYRHESLYLEILRRWEAGDFSKAVEDHNSIWRLQGGTIGEAQRLYTPEEEEAYVEENFR